MKNILSIAIATTAILLTGITAQAATIQKSDDFKQDVYRLEMSGVMTIHEQKTSNYMIYIFQDGVVTDSFFVDNRREQYFGLELNHSYTLKFTKEGYKDRLMIVDTHLPEDAQSDNFNFRYEVEFIAKDAPSNTFDDFPVAYVMYDAKQKDFDYNRTYHYNVRYNAGKTSRQTASQLNGKQAEIE